MTSGLSFSTDFQKWFGKDDFSDDDDEFDHISTDYEEVSDFEEDPPEILRKEEPTKLEDLNLVLPTP